MFVSRKGTEAPEELQPRPAARRQAAANLGSGRASDR
jgi:hypothetical protein